METRYEIIVQIDGVNHYLDTYKYEPISLTYNIADIADISKRNSSFSRTISLPETVNNREVFSNISDLAVDSTFNPNLKSRAWILVDTIVVFEGYLQLKSIKLSDTLENVYEVVIFADNDTFFTRMGDSYIEDLEYTDLNHICSTSSVINSWTSGQDLGYFYPLIDYGQGWLINDINGGSTTFSSASQSYVNWNEIFPATYVKTIWDKIFNKWGFNYDSTFLESQKFKDLIIPFNGNEFNYGPDYDKDKIFRVGAQVVPQVMTASGPFAGQYYIINNAPGNIKLNNESAPNADPNGLWNTSTYTYTNLSSDVFKQRFGFEFDLTLEGPPIEKILRLQIYRQYNPDGTQNVNWAGSANTGLLVGNEYDIFQQSQSLNSTGNGVTLEIISNTSTSTRIRFRLYSKWLNSFLVQNSLSPIRQNEGVRFNFYYQTIIQGGYSGNYRIIINDGYAYNEVSNEIALGQSINYKNLLPKKIKQKDFISSIIKMFNLYIEPSKDLPNTLVIEPRDIYYTLGQVKDWTDKIDLNVDIKEKILGDIQDKQVLFTYKDDKDRLNTYYKSIHNEIYGQYLYESENEFTKSVKKIDVIFSPSPLAKVVGSVNLAIPRIVKDDINYNQLPGGRIDSNIRILRRWNDGNNNGLLPYYSSFDKFAFEGVIYTQGYPYAGHYDNPYTQDDDINWGQLKDQYFESVNATDNNLVNNYWIQFLDENLNKDARIITVEMYLTPTDIHNFRFCDIIYLFFNGSGHYYKVNKISNFDPGLKKTCSVELIKSLEIPKIKRANVVGKLPNSVLSAFSTNVINLKESNNVTGNGVITTGKNNDVYGSDLFILGSSNDISSDNSIVNGDFNSINSDTKSLIINGDDNFIDFSVTKSIISGDNNIVNPETYNLNISGDNNVVGTGSNNIQVFGSNNTVSPGLTNSIVLGDGVTATQSNQTYIGNNIITNSGPLTPPDLQDVLDEGSGANISTYFDVTTSNTTGLRLQWNDGTNFTSIEAGGNTGIDLVTNNDNTPSDNGTINLEVQNTGVIQLYNLGNGSNNVGVDITTGYVPTFPTSVKINDVRFFNYFTGAGTTGTSTTTISEICKLKSGANFIKIYVTAYESSTATGNTYEVTSCWTWDGTTATQQGGGDLVTAHGGIVGIANLITVNTGNTIDLSITGVTGYTLTWSAVGVLY